MIDRRDLIGFPRREWQQATRLLYIMAGVTILLAAATVCAFVRPDWLAATLGTAAALGVICTGVQAAAVWDVWRGR